MAATSPTGTGPASALFTPAMPATAAAERDDGRDGREGGPGLILVVSSKVFQAEQPGHLPIHFADS